MSKPKDVLKNLYEYLEEEYYDHDLDNIQNVATDVDALYNFKYPHIGSGKIESKCSEWQKHIPDDMAKTLINKYRVYNQYFYYT